MINSNLETRIIKFNLIEDQRNTQRRALLEGKLLFGNITTFW